MLRNSKDEINISFVLNIIELIIYFILDKIKFDHFYLMLGDRFSQRHFPQRIEDIPRLCIHLKMSEKHDANHDKLTAGVYTFAFILLGT